MSPRVRPVGGYLLCRCEEERCCLLHGVRLIRGAQVNFTLEARNPATWDEAEAEADKESVASGRWQSVKADRFNRTVMKSHCDTRTRLFLVSLVLYTTSGVLFLLLRNRLWTVRLVA